MKVEQATGLPFLEIKVDKADIARVGLSLSAVQDVMEPPSVAERRSSI